MQLIHNATGHYTSTRGCMCKCMVHCRAAGASHDRMPSTLRLPPAAQCFRMSVCASCTCCAAEEAACRAPRSICCRLLRSANDASRSYHYCHLARHGFLIVHLMLKSLLLFSQAAFPIILVRCRSILQQFAADQRSDPGSVDSQRMEEVVCVLEVHQRNDVKLSAIKCAFAYKID